MTSAKSKPAHFHRTTALDFVRRRLSLKGYLGLHLTLGMILLAVAGWIFGEITEDVVTKDPSLQVDQTVAMYFHDHATPRMAQTMKAISFIGSGAFLGSATAVIGLYFAWKRRWLRLLMLMLVVPGGTLLNVAVKHLIHRDRPLFENPIATLDTFSFPSGHTMGATLFYGLLAYFVMMSDRRWATKLVSIHLAAIIILLVGLSRIYLGLHFLSDVLGAMAAAAAWLALCVTAVETYRRRKEAVKRQNPTSKLQ
jgi:undecaprenyl-diphosphatase